MSRIRQTISQRQTQNLLLKPKMLQSLEMLAMPLLELETHLKQEMISNPMLEINEEREEDEEQKDNENNEKEAAEKEQENDEIDEELKRTLEESKELSEILDSYNEYYNEVGYRSSDDDKVNFEQLLQAQENKMGDFFGQLDKLMLNEVDYEFAYEAEKAFRAGDMDSFEAGGIRYGMERQASLAVIYSGEGGNREEYAIFSRLSIQPISQDVFLTVDFKKELSKAIENRERSFLFPDSQGNQVEYELSRLNNVYTVKTETETHIISIHEQPSWDHWLGTDKHGMDVLTRLMYGGRISLTIGFIVVLLESILGIIMGGLAGYFGKWVDMVIMRIVDVFNCIPFLPLLIILGAVMDQLEVAPQLRIYFLMLILGLMSWPGIARMVRGQILSLREQEFMLAAEATGISVSRRIFKHLVPNVIPQLIVFATMGLGSVILYESTLSFLGLGVKFPLASWGNIISGVSTAYEMTNFWFVWIPAGMLILLTVLGFNFVGDGLRDAFDPKMKR